VFCTIREFVPSGEPERSIRDASRSRTIMARIVVSQTDRLLLHLIEMEAYREEPEVPLGASQEGIAQRLGTQVHNASRALSALEAEGLVMDRLAHVRGAPKRRRAYFLTDRGHKAANKVKEDLLKTKVMFEDRGSSESLSVGEVMKRLKAQTGTVPAFFDLIELVRSGDVLRSGDLLKSAATAGGRERFVEAAYGRPKVSAFYGREGEQEMLDEFIKGDDSVMLIWGIPGIGKTSLGSRLYDESSGHWNLFWYSLHTWENEEHFLTVLSRFLESAGRSAASGELRRGRAAGSLFGSLMNDLTALRAVLFIDDLHKAKGRLVQALSVLIEAVRGSHSCKIVLMSREMPQYFSRTDEGIRSLELSGLDTAAARALAKNLMAEDPNRTADASRGHPLLLKLMSRSPQGESKGDVVSFIEREVSMSLSSEEREVLEILSVYRHPVPPEAIANGAGTTLAGLKDKALVTEQEQGLWTHDVLRDFLLSRMGSESRSRLHGIAAKYCDRRDGSDWKLESLHHHVEAGDFASAKRVTLSASSELSSEFPQETLDLLSRMPIEQAEGDDDVGILMLMGQLSEDLGDDVSAAKYYQMCIDALPEGGLSSERALALEALGKLKTRVEQWTESFAAHEKALRIYQRRGDAAGQTREWLNIGGAHRLRADRAKARDAYSEALSLASTKEDRSAQAACLNNLALLEWDEGRLREAELRLKESIRLSHAVDDHAGEARGLENLAELYRVQAKRPESERLLIDASEAYRRGGELEESKRILAACAESLGSRAMLEDGVKMCRTALSRPDLRRKSGLFQRASQYDRGDASLSIVLMALARESGDLEGAQRESVRMLSIADSLDDQTLRAKAKVELALVKESSGDLGGAATLLDEASRMLNSIGDKRGLVAVHMVLGNVEEKRGNLAEAKVHYEEAARHAEILGDASAIGAARRNLDAIDAE
jgi:tetratricopeptide (TPR) repeat protein/DNA-binding MarR family transcriptional regulator